MKFRLIDTGYDGPFMNMAIDEALLTSRLPVLRFYQWKPSSISIGYSQSLENEVDVKKCKKFGIGYVRRITGGKTVFHENDLTYSIIISQDIMPKSLLDSYRKISEGIINGLLMLGLDPKMNDENIIKSATSNCFIEPSYYEITINNKKLVGSAQKRTGGKILQHGIILVDVDINKLCSLFLDCSNEQINNARERITSINNELIKRIDKETVKKALMLGFKKVFNAKLIPSKLTAEEKKIASYLAKNKYSTFKWNHMR